MAVNTKLFVPDVVSCREANNAGSTIVVSRLPNCVEEPNTYTITLGTAVVEGDEEISVTLTEVTDAEGQVISPIPESILLREDTVLHFEDAVTPGTYVEVKLTTEATVTSAAAVTASILEAPADIAAGDVAETWAMGEITDATDLPVNSDSQNVSRKTLKNGLQSSEVKTSVALNVPLQYITNPDNDTQLNVILPASQSDEDIFAVVLKSSGLMGFGRAKVSNYSATGTIDEIERVSATLNFQAPFALTSATVNPTVNTSAQLAEIQKVLRLSGLPSIS